MRWLALYLYLVGAWVGYYTTEVLGGEEWKRASRGILWPTFPFAIIAFTLDQMLAAKHGEAL